MIRAAVQVGAAWLRLAVDEPRPRLLAELPQPTLGRAVVDLFDGPVDELVVVHPAGTRPAVPPGVAAGAVRTVPAAVAAAFDQGDLERVVVVDVGHTGAEVAFVEAGRVVAVRRVAAGGAQLDAMTRRLLAGLRVPVEASEARRVREALSLRPAVRPRGALATALDADDLRAELVPSLTAVVDAVRAVLLVTGPGRAPPVLLIGGVARTPVLAELLDAAGVGGVRVAERPDAAAVLGALRLPPHLTDLLRSTGPPRAATAFGTAAGPTTSTISATSTASPSGSWLPAPARGRHRGARAALVALAATATAAGLLAAGAALPPDGPDPARAAAGDLVQYGYAVRLPAGWAHTGGFPERRRSLLTPVGAPDGSDLISVERTPLGYDAAAEPRRARAELRATFAAAVAAGAPLTGFDDDARFAGRPVVAYRESGGGEAGDVDWYVVLDGDAQLSVGCRHTARGATAVGAACATVVGSLRRTA